jgi:hypothetical protein
VRWIAYNEDETDLVEITIEQRRAGRLDIANGEAVLADARPAPVRLIIHELPGAPVAPESAPGPNPYAGGAGDDGEDVARPWIFVE